MYTLIPAVYRALLKSAVSGIVFGFIPLRKISFGLCLLQLTARGWETSRLKASQLQLSQKHSQLSIDTDIYYLRLIRDFMRHLT